ncbi:MAG: glycosyltransferase [Acidobacteria bacterium]|nr:MAG: glycosyltransferase [Acidobacteriota bacterium]
MTAGVPLRRGLGWLRLPGALPAKLRRVLQRRRVASQYRAAVARGGLVVEAGPLPSPRLITVAMPVFRVSESHLRAALASVVAQTWPHWELVVVDDAAPEPHVARVLGEFSSDPRVRVVRRSSNGGIAVASDDAVAEARGEFVAFLDHDDELHPRALELAARFLAAHPATDWLFTDEDKLDEHGRHCEPILKPGWSRHVLMAFNYVSHVRVVRRSVVQRVGGHRSGLEGAQDYDLALRVLAAGGRFAHLPGILYHWRTAPGSMASLAAAKPQANGRALAALLEHVRAFPRGGEATGRVLLPNASIFRVRRHPDLDLSRAVAVVGGRATGPATPGPRRPPAMVVEDDSPAALVAAARKRKEEIIVLPPPGGMSAVQLAELLALLQVPGTAVAAGRLVARRRVAASGLTLLKDGAPSDPWSGLHMYDPGYLNLALVPGRRLLPPPFGWAAWRSTLLAAWDAAPDVEEPWRLAVGWARFGTEVVTTPDVTLPVAARCFPAPGGAAPGELPRSATAGLALLGLLP